MTDTASSAQRALPLFYRAPAPVNPQRHGGVSVRPQPSLAFAAQTNSVPVNAVEVPLAARHYPIVFAGTTEPIPAALVGIRPAENLYVDRDGAWDPNSYIPAYVRRYPFIFMETQDADRLLLCIDEGSEAVVAGLDNPLFRDGQPSELTQNALKFCEAFQREFTLTRMFGKALAESGILVENTAEIELISGEKLRLTGFRVIDEKKLNELPDDVFLDWRRRGFLNVIYPMLASGANWAFLINRQAGRGPANLA